MDTPTIITPLMPIEKIIEPSGDSGSCPSIKSAFTDFRTPQQITVILKGLVFNATVSVDVWTAEISAAKQLGAELPESDYIVIADLSDFNNYRKLTLNARSVGKDGGVTLTLAGQNAKHLSQERLASSLGAIPNFSYDKSIDHALAEKGHAWIPYSTRNLTPKFAKKSLYGSAGCIVIPSNTVLNLRTLVNAFDRLSTQQIEKGIQELIDLLDYRSSDPDLEVDVDFEPEIEERSSQLI